MAGLFRMMIIKLQSHFPLRVTDWLAAGILTSWGFCCLALPPQAWELPVHEGLARIAGQPVWGIAATGLGLVRMTALFINGAVRRTPHVRAIGAFLSAFLWLQLSFAMFMTSMPTISVAIYPWLFVADIYNVFRAAQDARIADQRAKELRGAHRNAAAT